MSDLKMESLPITAFIGFTEHNFNEAVYNLFPTDNCYDFYRLITNFPTDRIRSIIKIVICGEFNFEAKLTEALCLINNHKQNHIKVMNFVHCKGSKCYDVYNWHNIVMGNIVLSKDVLNNFLYPDQGLFVYSIDPQ
jgi:hypothetical protein